MRSALRKGGEGALEICVHQQRPSRGREKNPPARVRVSIRRTRVSGRYDSQRCTGKASIPCHLKMHPRRSQTSSVSVGVVPSSWLAFPTRDGGPPSLDQNALSWVREPPLPPTLARSKLLARSLRGCDCLRAISGIVEHATAAANRPLRQ